MSNDNITSKKWNTFPLDQIFNSNVVVDLKHYVIFDKHTRFSIGFITSNNSKFEIHMELFYVRNDARPLEAINIKDYFNGEVITFDQKNYIEFHFTGGYICIGRVLKNDKAELSLPRLMCDPNEYAQEDEGI